MVSAALQTLLQHLRTAAAAEGVPGLPDALLLQRFTAGQDEAAFELLVWRHGRMVYNTCRRVLRDTHAAEDAFQATFLVLARRAASINRRDSLAGWLHRVAYRIALAGKSRGTVLPARDLGDLEMLVGGPDPSAEAGWREVRRLIDEAVNDLPAKYRVPFILCYFQGQTNAETARELGCPVGTVESRLVWARRRLRARLARCGVLLSAGVFAVVMGPNLASAAVPVSLIHGTARAAAQFAARRAVDTLSASAALLANGVLRKMWLSKLQVVAAVLLTVVLIGGGVGFLAPRAGAQGKTEAAHPFPVKDASPRAQAREADRPANTLSVKGLVIQAVNVKRKTITVSSEPITVKVKGDMILDGGLQLRIEGMQFDMGYRPPRSEFRVDRKARIQLKGEDAELDDLKPGMKVTIELGTGPEQAVFGDKDTDLERDAFVIKAIQAE
jgi:RNA polymerase sigma factor (sigma-70 family)